MKRDMNQWIETIKADPQRRCLPIMTYPGLVLTSQGILDVVRDGERQFRCIEALAAHYPSQATVTIMDLSVEAEAFGSPISFSEDDVPTVTERLVSDEESALALQVPPITAGRTHVYLTAARRAAETIADRPVFGGHIGPFSLAARLFDMTEIMMALLIQPDVVKIVLEKTTAFLKQYAAAYKAAGANGIVIAEPAAGLLNPEQCEEFSSVYVKQIVEHVQDDNFLVMLHNCGKTVELVPSMLGTGARLLHFGNAVAMTDILPQIPQDRLAFGNIDPARTFRNGTVEEMISQTRALLEAMEPYRNYVLSSGCDVPPNCPPANIDAFFQTLAEYNATREPAQV